MIHDLLVILILSVPFPVGIPSKVISQRYQQNISFIQLGFLPVLIQKLVGSFPDICRRDGLWRHAPGTRGPSSRQTEEVKLTTKASTSVPGIENQQGYACNIKIARVHIPYEPFTLH